MLVQITLPLPLKGPYTYRVPPELQTIASPGSRAIVNFGRNKFYTGIIWKVLPNSTSEKTYKAILDIPDPYPILNTAQLQFFDWISEYYMCTLGETLNAGLPAAFKISSEAFVSLAPDLDIDQFILTEKEEWIVRKLLETDLHVEDIKKLTGTAQPYKLIKSLQDRGIVHVLEKLKSKYRPKKERRLRLNNQFQSEESLDGLLTVLEKKTKQIDAIVAYLKLTNALKDPSQNKQGVAKADLVKEGISPSSVQTLLKNQIFKEWEEIIDRFAYSGESLTDPPALSPIQQETKDHLLRQMENQTTILLKGITGSGKTEIYMSLIHDVIDQGGRVLYLLPEIGLTTQIIGRLRKVFGNRFAVYHSKFSDSERVEVWKKCLEGEVDFVVGVRSSVFLPLTNVSLIIVDEEHETSFKQQEPAPRYNARDAAIYLAHHLKAKVILGSATPSWDSYTNAKDGKYGFVELTERFNNQPTPQFHLADLARERKRKTIKGNFSSTLLKAIEETVAEKKQVLLFQNRRGYSPFLLCDNCGHTPKCPNCSVSLTYHIYQNTLNCHLCGYHESMPSHCDKCSQPQLKPVGVGTEKIEEELSILLPNVRIQRMDLDSTRSKYSYQDIIDRFEQGEIDVLIGTQMITKGLDFENVKIVGVFDADRLIHFPDFRSHERAFQTILQVGGRAGRKNDQGQVIIQTNDPSQTIFDYVMQANDEGFFQQNILDRKKFRYPPFFRLIVAVIRHKDKQTAFDATDQLAFLLKKQLGRSISDPIEPVISKIRNYYRYQLYIRIEKGQLSLTGVKQFLLASKDTLLALQAFKSVRVHFDVDPL